MLDLNPQQILRILAARYRLALTVMAAAVVVTFLVCLVWPEQYTATTTVVVDTKSPDPVASALSTTSVGGVQNFVLSIGTEAEIIGSHRVATRVAQILKLGENPQVRELWKRDTSGRGDLEVWLGELLLKKLTVKTTAPSNVIAIKFVGAEPEFTALVANTFARAYIETTLALKIDAAKQSSEWFSQQEKTLRQNLERAQAKMSAFQQDKGILAMVEQQDNETAHLNDLEKQYVTALAASAEALGKKNSGDEAEFLPEVAAHSLLTGLKSDLARHEAKLQEAAGNLGKNHPQYQRMESEIAAIRETLRVETRNVISSFSSSRGAAEKKAAELRAAMQAQKKKLLRIKDERNQLAVLEREVETARKALDAVAGRYQQVNLVSQAIQTQISILTPAVAPLEPSAPKVLLYMLLSIPVGLLLGAAAALSLEMFDRRIRSAEDLAGMLKPPLLGTITRRRPPSRRMFFLRRPQGMAVK